MDRIISTLPISSFRPEGPTRFGGNFFDVSSAPPTRDPPTVDLVTEIYKVLVSNGQKPDPTAVYILYTSNFPNQNYYCAFHDYDPAPAEPLFTSLTFRTLQPHRLGVPLILIRLINRILTQHRRVS
jgi:hypothetical protein